MNETIVWFLAAGAVFGLLTASRRHLFSEGATRPAEPGSRAERLGALGWVVLCTLLWPLLAAAGAFGAWHRWRLRRA